MDNPNPQTQETPPGDQVPVQETVQAAEPEAGDIMSMLKNIAAGVARTEATQASQAEQIAALQAQIGKVEKLEAAEVETKPKIDAVEEKIQSIEKNLPAEMPDNEAVELADTVAETERTAHMVGKRVKHIPSDTLKSYIARALNELKEFSPAFKNTPIDVMVADAGMMRTCHKQVLADAMRAAYEPAKHGLQNIARAVTEKFDSGHTQTKWVGGDANRMFDAISMPPMKIKQFGTGDIA